MKVEEIRALIVDSANSGDPLHNANYLVFYIFKQTGKLIQLQINRAETLNYWDLFEWCRAKVFEWVKIIIVYDNQGRELRYC